MIQGSVRRLVFGFIVACVLAFVLFKAKEAEAQVHVASGCKGLTSGDAMYWIRHCYLYPANAADLPHRLAYVRVR